MKRILVPTDFSEFASYAVDTAIKLAKLTDGTITLYHTVEQGENQSIVSRSKLATERLSKIKAKIIQNGIDCTYTLGSGIFPKDFVAYLKTEVFDLVIMGSHGQSGFNEMFIGSNTQRLLRKSSMSIMVVKKPVATISFKNVVFVSGLNIEDQDALRLFLESMETLKVEKLHIMAVDTLSYFSQPTILMKDVLNDFKTIASGYNVEKHFYKDYSVGSGVRHFSEENDIDLIVISNHKKHPIKRIFQGSNVETVVNSSNCPVLALDYV